MQTITWDGGGIPVGYIYNESKKQLEFDPVFKDVVKLIYHFASSGLSALEIAEELNKRKIQSRRGAQWSYKTVSYLFTPQKIMFYAGIKDNLSGNWPAIISQALAQRLISKSTVTTVNPRPRFNTFLLTGIDLCFCGYCGGKIKSSTTKRKNSISHYYLCANKQMRGVSYCPESKVVNQDFVNDKIIESLKRQQSNITNIKKFSAAYTDKQKSGSLHQLNLISKKINQLLAKQNTTYNNQDLAQINSNIRQLIDQRTKIVSAQIIDFDFNEFQKTDLRSFHKLSISRKQEILKKFISRITVKANHLIIEYPFIVDTKGNKTIMFES